MPKQLLYFDSETCGLHGLPVLFQYAVEEGPITLYDVWRHPIRETLQLIEWMYEHPIVGFNLVFDFFMLCKTYTIFRLGDPDWLPVEHIEEIALLEPRGMDGPCIKPYSVLDLLLHSRKGIMQSLMGRDNVRINRVPTVLADALAVELENRIQFDDILFAKSFDPEAPKWIVFDRKDTYGAIDPDFKDVVLRFNPAGGLKFLAEHVLKLKPKYHYKDVEPAVRPKELGYAPTALAMSSPEEGWVVIGKGKDGKPKEVGHAWPAIIKDHIEHWATREDARDYANDDIVYTRALYHHYGDPPHGDNDSILTGMVAAVRWHGFKIDKPGIHQLMEKAQALVDASPVNIHKPTEVRAYITEAMDDMEKIILETSTKKTNLEAIGAWELDESEPCSRCTAEQLKGEHPSCERCGGTGVVEIGPHPAATRAKEILAVRIASSEVKLYSKLLHAGRFHASFKIIGTLSSRMSGGDGLNAQGIKHTTEVRQMFPMKWGDYDLSIGDFSAFEVTIADAVCDDEALRAELMAGRKIHALFGMALFPGHTYEEIKETDGTENDLYTKGKQGFFGAILYGGDFRTLMNKLGVKEDNAVAAIETFGKKYKGVGRWRRRVSDAFCSMTQPGGIGTQVIWKDPQDYAETMFGFRRYFTLENQIAKTLFTLANKPPKHWKKIGKGVKVCRRDRVQTASGAVQSALFGASFATQAACMRAAANHEIQSPGAEITKGVQKKLWDLQPAGVHDFLVAPFNVHDEIACVNKPGMAGKVAEVVRDAVESYRPYVPLIGMEWITHAETWADKKGSDSGDTVIITYEKPDEN